MEFHNKSGKLMFSNLKKCTLFLEGIRLRPSQIHKFRGVVGNTFKEYDLIHNHDQNGKLYYRYPLIQFKLINREPGIVSISDKAVKIFSEIFMKLNQIEIDGTAIPIYEKNLQVEDNIFGYFEEKVAYEFVSPWIGLNQKNYKRYVGADSKKEKDYILRQSLIGNILSMSKYLGYWLEECQEIKAELKLSERKVNLKGKTMLGFVGIFKVSFAIPDYLGIGKSVSRGFGTVKRIN